MAVNHDDQQFVVGSVYSRGGGGGAGLSSCMHYPQLKCLSTLSRNHKDFLSLF